MNKSSFSLLSTVSLLCLVGFLNQAQAIPETEDREPRSSIPVKEGGWQQTRDKLLFHKFDENTLEGAILNQVMKMKEDLIPTTQTGMHNQVIEMKVPLFEEILEICTEDCRRLYSLREDHDAVIKAQKTLIDFKLQLIQQLSREEPITREQKQHLETLRTQYTEFGSKALQAPRKQPQARPLNQELPDMTQCEAFAPLPKLLDIEYLQLVVPILVHDSRSFPDYGSRNDRREFSFPGEFHKRPKFLEELVESHKNWSRISPDVAMNRLDVFLSLCKNNQIRNNYLDYIKTYYDNTLRFLTRQSEVTVETYKAFEQFYKANYKTGGVRLVDKRSPACLERDPFFKLMKVTPTPLYRAYFTSLLDYDPSDVQEYLRPDFPLDLNQSREDAKWFFMCTFPKIGIEVMKRQWVYDSLKIMYHNKGIDTPFLDELNQEELDDGFNSRFFIAAHRAANYVRGVAGFDDEESKELYLEVMKNIQAKGEEVFRSLNMEIPHETNQ